jgi:hypothetical protein
MLMLGVLLASSMPAQARTIAKRSYTVKITSAPVPCAVACAYWLENANNRDLDIYFNACRAPAPPASFTDIVLRAPNNANVLVVKSYPLSDWDTFLCSKPSRGNNGRELANGANSATDTDNCTFGIGFGCMETMRIRVREYQRYVFRAYNWSDAADMPVRVYWMRI